MIIGTSMDAKTVDIYKNRNYPYNTIEVDWLNKEDLSDKIAWNENEWDYDLIDSYKCLPYINEGRGYVEEFNTEKVKLLLECDYCGNKFTNTWQNRRRKAAHYLGNFYPRDKTQKNINENIDLYKDNCDACSAIKRQETTMINNGYWHPSQTENHRGRMARIFQKHNMVPTSRGQRYIAKLLGAELNVLVDYYFADMVLDDKIVIEYDGGGHNLGVLMGDIAQKQFDNDEKIRSEHLFSKGYKLIRFISPNELFPADEQYTKQLLCEAISELYLTEKKEIHIAMNSRVDDPDHGKLKPIKAILKSSEWGADIL